LPSDSLESGSNPHISSHGHSGAERTKLPLSARTSKQKRNCNAKPVPTTARLPVAFDGFSLQARRS
jgi:hypothetical protein